jgi:hypothetical protein
MRCKVAEAKESDRYRRRLEGDWVGLEVDEQEYLILVIVTANECALFVLRPLPDSPALLLDEQLQVGSSPKI